MAKGRSKKSKVDANPQDKEQPAKRGRPEEDDDDDNEPQAVSSSDNSDDETTPSTETNTDKMISSSSKTTAGMSRLFAPFRTLGLVSTAPFSLIPHQNSQSAMLCIPIGDRFQIMKTERLNPVMVSQSVSHPITHTVADATLGATVVGYAQTHVTLYQRTTPLVTQKVALTGWNMQEMLHMGRIQVDMKGEKEGKRENAAVIVVVLAREESSVATGIKTNADDAADVPIVGDELDSSEDDESRSDSDEEEEEDNCQGQVVVLIASRTTLQVHRRIRLTTLPTFRPRTAMHPATYVNKIVVAGVDDKGSPVMCLLNFRTEKVIHVFSKCLPPPGANNCCITSLEQSPAIDTIAVGTDSGMVHLVNLRHDKKLFSLKHAGLDGKPVGVTSLSFRNDASAMKYGIAPLAVGRSDGSITVWDLTPPEDPNAGRTVLCTMDRVHVGGVAKLQYLPQEPLLVSTGFTSNSVLMHIFDNPDHSGRILRKRKGHTAPPSCINYLNASGGVMANSSDGTDASSCQILSSGGPDRTLRVFSSARSVLDKEYSQGAGLEKRARQLGLSSTAELLLPPLTDMALCQTRRRDWGDLVTIHERHSFAYVWSTKRGAQSGPILRQNTWNVSSMKVPPPAETHATSVTISPCGNFALVGTRGGVIYRYNIQSGIPRGSYPKDATDVKDERRRREVGSVKRTMKALEKKMTGGPQRASNIDKQDFDIEAEAKREARLQDKLRTASHSGFAVTGLAMDSVNKTLISVGADAKLILWKFETHAPHKKSPYRLPSPATKLCHVRESDLAAIALQDFSIILFDCAALSIVRRFGSGIVSHTGPISDMGFSPDGRNLYTSSLDGTIRVWDVPTNTCVDWLSFRSPPTSLAVSPTGEFLTTTHSGKVGISMWSDRSFYQQVNTGGLELKEPFCMDEPSPMAEENWESSSSQRGDAETGAPNAIKAKAESSGDTSAPVTAKAEGLVTLSGLPPAHWKNLFHLELVKERNKPTEAPKKPPSAPFFLQWRSGDQIAETPAHDEVAKEAVKAEDDEWAAAWSDDDAGEKETVESSALNPSSTLSKMTESEQAPSKRRKVTHHRSHLATLLEKCSQNAESGERRFQEVSDYVATLGPSAIDVELSTLCNGMHDIEDGLPLLLLASQWLLEACNSRERYEAVNAYLHRFLHLHASVIAGMGESQEDKETNVAHPQRQTLSDAFDLLRRAQGEASEVLQSKMEHSICLLRHFSRMT